MKTKFAISSHINFHEKTYSRLVDSLLVCGIPPEDIYFFIGGCETYEEIHGQGVHVWKVDHNSIDFTGLVSVVDLKIESDRWFLLHDTTYVGTDFYCKVKEKKSSSKVIDMSQLFSKNMGSYSQEYLNEITPTLLERYKNKDLSIESTREFKAMNVKTENIFLKAEEFFNMEKPIITEHKIDFYGTNTPRSIQYYPGVDLYKVQSYYNSPGNYNIQI